MSGRGETEPGRRRMLPLLVIGAAFAAAFATGAITRWMEGGPPTPLPRVDAHLQLPAGAVPGALPALEAGRVRFGVDLAGLAADGTLEAALAAAQGGRVRLFAGLDWTGVGGPGWTEAAVTRLERVRALGAAGLTVPAERPGVALDDPTLDPVFQTAGRLDLPVAVFPPGCVGAGVGAPAPEAWRAALARRADRHPEVRFLAGCFAGLAEDPASALALLEAHPNLFLDTAHALAALDTPAARPAARRVFIRHPDRVLFGSGAQTLPPAPEAFYDGLQAHLEAGGLDLPGDVREDVLYGNAARLLDLPPARGSR